VDRTVAILGADVITLRQVEELEAYLRYRRDHARSALAQQAGGPLLREAYEEALTRTLALQRLRADPDFRLARGRARAEVERDLQSEAGAELAPVLTGYGLSMERFAQLESLTIAIQEYVRAKYRHAIVPSAAQIQQYIERHRELKSQYEQLSDAGKQEVRALIGRQLEFHNFMEQYRKFIETLRSETEILEVDVPEAR
jgi:hypothetical protein